MSANVVTVRDVYGRLSRVDGDILAAGKRAQIPLYTKSGQRLIDYYDRMGWLGRGLCTTIHRENIAEVITTERKGG